MRRRRCAGAILVLAGCVLAASCGGASPQRPRASSATSLTVTTTSPRTPPTTPGGRAPWKLSVDPTSLRVGAGVTVSGTNCPGASDVAVWVANADFPGDADLFGPSSAPLRTTPDGSWSELLTVPEGTVGSTALAAQCLEHGPLGTPGALEITYPPVAVTIASPYRLTVTPSGTVAPGTTLTVDAVGGGCPPHTVPVAGIESPSSSLGSVGPGSATADRSTSTGWQATVHVPSGTLPGLYDVVGHCYFGLGYPFRLYQSVPITVGG